MPDNERQKKNREGNRVGNRWRQTDCVRSTCLPQTGGKLIPSSTTTFLVPLSRRRKKEGKNAFLYSRAWRRTGPLPRGDTGRAFFWCFLPRLFWWGAWISRYCVAIENGGTCSRNFRKRTSGDRTACSVLHAFQTHNTGKTGQHVYSVIWS